MIIGIKDLAKLFAITVVVCCAVFVCSLFLNYNLDLTGIQDKITTETGRILYDAQLASGQVVASVSGGCLVVTTVIMLVFYVKNYIDSHGKELGILKALGYSRLRVARHFWVFGISAGIGSVLGCAGAWLYMPAFYEMQNAEGLFPELDPQFHPALSLALLALPAAFFHAFSRMFCVFQDETPGDRTAQGSSGSPYSSKPERKRGAPLFGRFAEKHLEKPENPGFLHRIFSVLLLGHDPDVLVYGGAGQ